MKANKKTVVINNELVAKLNGNSLAKREMSAIDGGGWGFPGWVGLAAAVYDFIKGFAEYEPKTEYVYSTINYDFTE